MAIIVLGFGLLWSSSAFSQLTLNLETISLFESHGRPRENPSPLQWGELSFDLTAPRALRGSLAFEGFQGVEDSELEIDEVSVFWQPFPAATLRSGWFSEDWSFFEDRNLQAMPSYIPDLSTSPGLQVIGEWNIAQIVGTVWQNKRFEQIARPSQIRLQADLDSLQTYAVWHREVSPSRDTKEYLGTGILWQAPLAGGWSISKLGAEFLFSEERSLESYSLTQKAWAGLFELSYRTFHWGIWAAQADPQWQRLNHQLFLTPRFDWIIYGEVQLESKLSLRIEKGVFEHQFTEDFWSVSLRSDFSWDLNKPS